MQDERAELLDLIPDLIEGILVPGKLVHRIVSIAVRISHGERGAVFAKTKGELEAKAQVGVSPQGLSSMRDVCTSYLGELRGSSNTVYVPDTRKDEKFHRISALRGSDILSFACVPLKIQGRTYGVLYLDSSVATQVFASSDLGRLLRFSQLITTAMTREDQVPEADLKIPVISVADYLVEHTMEEIEKERLVAILERNKWNVTRMCQRMVYHVYAGMQRLGIKRPQTVKSTRSVGA